jgi:cystathionine beta-lyase/cystathionine gamma-synthase
MVALEPNLVVASACPSLVHATSVGGVETTIERRAKYPAERHIPADLLRVSVGCEHVEDLWDDLQQALDRRSAAQFG